MRPGYAHSMSLGPMFDDLEGRFSHLTAEEMRGDAEELARAERARTPLVDRLRGGLGSRICVQLEDGRAVEGALAVLGADWLLLGEDEVSGARVLLPLGSICLIEGLPGRVRAPASGRLPARSIASYLRQVAADRSRVTIATGAGTWSGRIVAVGEDHVEIVREAMPQGRRSAPSPVTVPFRGMRSITID